MKEKKENPKKTNQKNETESLVFSILNDPESETDETKNKLEDLKEQFESASEQNKSKGRGRPKGSTKKAKKDEQEKIEFAETISGVASTSIELIVARLPNPKPLSDTEKKQIDTAFDKVAYKYANWLGNYQEESAFILVLLMVFIPRLNLLKAKKPEKNVDEQKS